MPENALQAAVFRSVYTSVEQRRLRQLAGLILGLKHSLRGILFSWPLYALAIAPFMITNEIVWWMVIFVLPALLVSAYILLKGVREDYSEQVTGKILKPAELKHMIWKSHHE